MSPEPIVHTGAARGRPWRFALALALFVIWAFGLGVMAFTSAERPRVVVAAPPRP